MSSAITCSLRKRAKQVVAKGGGALMHRVTDCVLSLCVEFVSTSIRDPHPEAQLNVVFYV